MGTISEHKQMPNFEGRSITTASTSKISNPRNKRVPNINPSLENRP
jgi:hypothetical protein